MNRKRRPLLFPFLAFVIALTLILTLAVTAQEPPVTQETPALTLAQLTLPPPSYISKK